MHDDDIAPGTLCTWVLVWTGARFPAEITSVERDDEGSVAGVITREEKHGSTRRFVRDGERWTCGSMTLAWGHGT